MKCNQSRLGFELVSPCPFPTTIAIIPQALPSKIFIRSQIKFPTDIEDLNILILYFLCSVSVHLILITVTLYYLSEFLRWGLICIILVVIFQNFVIFIVVSWKNILAAVSNSLPQVSFVYLSIQMIQPGKSFEKKKKKKKKRVESFLYSDKQRTEDRAAETLCFNLLKLRWGQQSKKSQPR